MERIHHVWARAYVQEDPAFVATGWKFALADHTRVVTESDEVVACGRLLPLRGHLGGREIEIGGVASLATLPEERRRGLTATLLGEMLTEMRERGMALSCLYPFDIRRRAGGRVPFHHDTY